MDKEAKAPVYVYYKLENFYQNHRRYVKSRVISQLKGTYKEVGGLSECDPVIKVEHLWNHQKYNKNGLKLKDSDPAIPCGLIAKSYFNDTFVFKKENNDVVPINE